MAVENDCEIKQQTNMSVGQSRHKKQQLCYLALNKHNKILNSGNISHAAQCTNCIILCSLHVTYTAKYSYSTCCALALGFVPYKSNI